MIKVLVFVALLSVFYAFGGLHWLHEDFGSHSHGKNGLVAWLAFNYLFILGAVTAVWGDKAVGIIHPVSFRSGYVILGTLIMILVLGPTILGRSVANSHRTNIALGSNAPKSELAAPLLLQKRPDLQELRGIDDVK